MPAVLRVEHFLKSEKDEQPIGLARDVWEINQNDLRLTEQLGRGMFGEVWKGFWNERVEVAVKQMRQGTMDPEAFRQEAEGRFRTY